MRLLIALALTLATGSGWAAQPFLVITQVDRDAPIGIYAVVRRNCSVDAAPEIRVTQAPAHGVIVVRKLRLAAERTQPCAPLVAPARQVAYRPAAGFSGQDAVTFEIVDGNTGRSDSHPVTIIVQPKPTGI